MKIRVQDGRVFEGTPTQIVQAMKSIAMGAPTMTLSEYVDWVTQRAFASDGTPPEGTNVTEEERCESLIARMLAEGFAERA